ncbi:MAG: bifunctional hydroxymethylpyrimidine kinase/phosphomethylpyrimidine kinase [Pseudomonadota bacterium]
MGHPVALSIAGSDPSGGAGIQADLKTFSALGVYGASAITLLTAQNTRGVQAVEVLSPGIVEAQIASVLEDLDVGAIKIGALGNAAVIEAVAEALGRYAGPVVLDPVMVAKSGDPLLGSEAVEALRTRLLPLATVVTPNLPEAAALAGTAPAESAETAEAQAAAILSAGARAVLLKDGHAEGAETVDVLHQAGAEAHRFSHPRIATRNTHGTGCTLSSAIAARMALGDRLGAAVGRARRWLQRAIEGADALGIGHGHGPLHHFHGIWEADAARPLRQPLHAPHECGPGCDHD